jgi:hypothetical protein
MKKAKKTKRPIRKTALDRIVARLRAALRRETKNVIEIGKLLIESREHLEHGEWQPWLAENFDLSLRTAQNYFAAAEYVARVKSKSATVADFNNLSPTVLYWLAAGQMYNEQEEAAILAAAKSGKRVDQDAAEAICEALAPADDDDAEDADDGGEDSAGDSGEDSSEDAAEDPEIAAMLDGPPPAVLPPAPIPPPPDFALRDFDDALSTLKRLMTKPSAQFASTIHNADDLEKIEDFIRAVTKARRNSHDRTERRDGATL